MHHLRLEIGTHRLGLEIGDASMYRRVIERYEAFTASSADEPDFTLEIRVDSRRTPPRLHPVWVDNPPHAAAGDLDEVSIDGEQFEGRLAWDAGRGRATIPDSLAHLDLFVRIVLGVSLLRRGEASLLHAAGVVRDGWSIAFAGPSGAGKSTLADLCRGDGLSVLADEMLVVGRAGAGTRMFGTPFWHGAPASAPAAAIFLLRHSSEHALEPVAPERALPELLKAGGAPLDLPAIQEAFFHAVGSIVRRVPVYRLSFSPDVGFWRAVDRRVEFAFWRPRQQRVNAASPRSVASPAPREMTRLSSARPRSPRS